MRSNRYYGKEQMKLVEVEKPVCGDNEVLMKNFYCGICGSDVAGYFNGSDFYHEDLAWGHEYVGEVVGVGKDVEGIKIGDIVFPYTLGGGFGDFSTFADPVLDKNIFIIDPSMDLRKASLIEPLSVGEHAAERTQAGEGDSAIVFGDGFIGMAAAIGLKTRGVKVLVVGISDFRLGVLKRMGFDVCNSAAQNLDDVVKEKYGTCKNSRGLSDKLYYNVDYYVEASGAAPAFNTIMEKAKEHARIVIASMPHAPRSVDLSFVNLHELSIVGSNGFTPENVLSVIRLVRSEKMDLGSLITHEYPLEEMGEAMETAHDINKSVKVLIKLHE